MLGQRPEEYTGPWGKQKRVTWQEKVSDPWQRDINGMTTGKLQPGVYRFNNQHVRDMGARQNVEDLPWFMQGEGGGFLGRRRTEIEEGLDPQKAYGLAAPSVRKTTEGLMGGIEEEAARTNRSPAMVALMKKGLLSSELEGLGAAAGQAASGAFGMKETAKAGLANLEAQLGAGEMAGRRGMKRARIPLQMQHSRFQREDRKQRESQNRLKSFFDSYNRG